MTTSPSGFKPLVSVPIEDNVSSPQSVPVSGQGQEDNAQPNEILSMWESLYFAFPSPGLKKRVQEVKAWAEGDVA